MRVPIVELPREKFARICTQGSLDQGVAALIEDVAIIELEDLLASLPSDRPAFLVALDSISDPHNMGAIIRTAECSGAHGVIVGRDGAAMITDTVVKASAGAVAHIPIARVQNLHKALVEIREHNIWVLGLESNDGVDMYKSDLTVPICVVVGSEGKGMRPVVRKTCDILVRIPMHGRISSLNASVAAAVVMYEVVRQRTAV
jgi:23S rRNA (guanosine2251-2'-O)-methyltransferase